MGHLSLDLMLPNVLSTEVTVGPAGENAQALRPPFTRHSSAPSCRPHLSDPILSSQQNTDHPL